MIIYSGSKKQFHDDVVHGVVADRLRAAISDHGVFGGSESEYNSWLNSLARMDLVVNDPGIPDGAAIALEYQIPTTAKRVDFMIGGVDEKDQTNILLVELKQWSEAERTSLDSCVRTVVGGAPRVVQHPCAQVYNYARLMENLNAGIHENGISLHPSAYLHNYRDDARGQIEDPSYSFYLTRVPLYLMHDGPKLTAEIKRRIKKEPRPDLFEVVDTGRLKPSKALQDSILPLLEGQEAFYMMDEQQVAYSTILHLVKRCHESSQKHTIVIQGGPGTGKSVIAVSLLARLIKEGFSCSYVTKNAAPREVFSSLLVQGNKSKAYIAGLFRSSGSFVDERSDRYDCLLVDEAHRLNAKSGMFSNRGENQIKELIQAARISVFFLDEDQTIHAKDIGSMQEIAKWSAKCGSRLVANDNLVLRSQFRCNGSDGYIAWLDNALGIRPTANAALSSTGLDYDLRIYRSPVKMREDLRILNQINNKARMVAGYCYDWESKTNTRAMDITLKDGFTAQWNFSTTKTWAIDQDSFDQVGCIHSSQGLEFDYVGVIIGTDLRMENGRVIADYTRRSRHDASVKGLKNRDDGDSLGDRIVRNTYKTLMSRGQKGCFVYCEDESLADRFVMLGAREVDGSVSGRRPSRKETIDFYAMQTPMGSIMRAAAESSNNRVNQR